MSTTLLSIILGQVVLPLEEPLTDILFDAGAIFVLFVFMITAVAERGRNERGQWHFKTSVETAARDAWRAKQRNVESQLRASNAEAATQARSKLVRVVMHDLRSPLLALHNMVDNLADLPPETSLSDVDVSYTTTAMRTCTDLMESIVSDLLDFERIESGRLMLVSEPFSFETVLADASLSFGSLARKKGINFVVDPPPDDLKGATFAGDHRRILQCVGNGISNATKFTDPGGTITLSLARGATPQQGASTNGGPDASGLDVSKLSHIDLFIKDTGVGILPDELDLLRAGEAFSQVGRGQLQGNGGTGLGLTIVRQILALMNKSSMHLYSEGYGKGTQFHMRLHLEQVPPPCCVLARGGPGNGRKRHSGVT